MSTRNNDITNQVHKITKSKILQTGLFIMGGVGTIMWIVAMSRWRKNLKLEIALNKKKLEEYENQ